MRASKQEIYYLKSILGHLRELDDLAFRHRRAMRPCLGSEVLNDNIDWLDFVIGKLERVNG